MKLRCLIIAILITLCFHSPARANECIAPKPPKISGALCGRLIDATGAAVPNVMLQVLAHSDGAIADAQSDSRGDFTFPGLAKGSYRLKTTSTGWLIEFGDFEIKNSKKSCKNPVMVRLDVACCCFGSGIIKKKPSHY